MSTISVTCPNPECQAVYEVGQDSLGKKARCKSCGKPFRLTVDTMFEIDDGQSPVDSAEIEVAPSRPAWMQRQNDTEPEANATTRPMPAPEKNRKKKEKTTDSSVHVGETLARFELRELLGAGGFGNVYLAYDPVLDREVALKVPQADAFSDEDAAAEFLGEARAAAQLRHPNIVPIYDAGRTDTSFYIASAFIAGQPLNDAIREKGTFTFDEAVSTVAALARALGYAHEQRIVHRDVKPHNIMIDGDGAPHLMDFGLARTLDAAGQFKAGGRISGTPAYMSPEQASGSKRAAVGAASDQYSLGAVLYELLTGERPFEGPPDVILFNVRKTEPPGPASIRKEVPADLEAICLKAMSKDEGERYASCEEFADDLRRWQENRPVLARKASNVERLRKWARRNPAVASLVGVTMLGLLIMLVGSQWYNALLATALEESDASLQAAQQTVDDILEQIRSDEFKQVPGVQPLREKLTSAVTTRYEALSEQYPDNYGLKAGLARARTTHAKVIQDIGSGQEALAEFQQALEMQKELVEQFPDNRDYSFDLAESHAYIGQWYWENRRYAESVEPYQEAEKILVPLLEKDPDNTKATEELAFVYNGLGNAHRNTSDDPTQALPLLKKARELFEVLANKSPDDPKYVSYPTIPIHNMALVYEDEADYESALSHLDTCQKIERELITSDSATSQQRSNYSLSLRNRARVLLMLKRNEEATADIDEAIERGRTIVARNPYVHNYRRVLGGHLSVRASFHLRDKEYDQAETLFQETVAILDESVELGSGTSLVAIDLLSAYIDLANLHRARKGMAAAETATVDPDVVAALDSAISRGAGFSKQFPDDPAVNWEYARVVFKRGKEETLAKNDREALAFFDQALEIVEQHVLTQKRYSKYEWYVENYLTYLTSAANVAVRAGLNDKVSEYADAGTTIGKGTKNRASLESVCTLMDKQANIYKQQGRTDDAITLLKKCLAIAEPQLEKYPWHWYFRQSIASSYRRLASVYESTGEPEKEIEAWRRHLEVWGKPMQNMGEVEQEMSQSSSPPAAMAKEYREKIIARDRMKKFTIPCQFGARTEPFDVYITHMPPDTNPLEDQAKWLWEERKGVIPKDVRTQFRKLLDLSFKNNIPFPDLCVYALEAAKKELQKK